MCWLQSDKSLYILSYEKLQQNLKVEMRKILKFLGQPVSEKVLDCVERNSGGIYRRKHSDFNPYTEVNPKILKRIEDVKQTVETKLETKIRWKMI